VSRLLALACALRSRGTEALFAGTGREMAHVAASGFAIHPIWEPEPEVLFGAIRARKVHFVTTEILRAMVEADLALFEELGPTAVLTDGRLSAPISTRVASLPHGAIVNASSTRFRAIPYLSLFAAPGQWLPPLGPAMVALECRLFDLFMGVFRQVAKEYGVPNATTPTDCLTGNDLTIIPDLPEFFPTRHLPDSYHYVGPITWSPASGGLPTVHFPDTAEERPRLYVTFGTTGDAAVLARICELLATSGYQVVVTAAGHRPLPPAAGETVEVVDYADGDELCEEAALVICHGGNGTIYQALRHGRPIIGIPFIPDQEYNMRRVEALGLGKAVAPTLLQRDPQVLMSAIETVLADGAIRDRCRQLGEKIRTASGPERAADLVIHHLLP